MIERKALLSDLKKQVQAAETDLGNQIKALPNVGARLRAEYDQARKLGRTAATWNSWLDERLTQVAVAWVLGTVFVRFCEDNRLIPEPYLVAPEPDRRDLARARYEAYVEEDPDPTYRGWLERAFAELGDGQAGRLLFDPAHNPLFQIPLSHDGAGALTVFWRSRDEHGSLIHDFTDPLNDDGTKGWDTRFLGDLYQDLSEAARSTYALLQTPEFVEEFILDRAMDPAVREFGHADLKMIDPTCGSGHFVLGAFRRLIRLWTDRPLGRDRHECVHAALDSVHGVDLNPFAIAVARFRLLIAAMAAADVRTLAEAAKYEWPIHLAIGDSLIKDRQLELTLTSEQSGDPLAEFSYATEDIHEHPRILEPGRYHVVVGNPPYITVKDNKLNELYRELYNACAGTYALSVPFAQRFFELAKRGDADGSGYGMVGQITANSFLKREFGTKLIENYFAHQVELAEVIDTSGAFIPGHGTPTVILIGSRRSGADRSLSVRTVRSVQGEPAAPEDGEVGLVWAAIVDQIDRPGSVGQWVSCDDLDRERYFAKQPWILADGGLEMIENINNSATATMASHVESIGRTTNSGADDAYFVPDLATTKRIHLESNFQDLVIGEQVRDYRITSTVKIANPYTDRTNQAAVGGDHPIVGRFLWPMRTTLSRRIIFGKRVTEHHHWFEYLENYSKRLETPLSIAFSFVARHNHFVLDRGGKVFKQSAPVIKLRKGANEEDYLRLLGLLNSSTACFWLKMVSQAKGGMDNSSGGGNRWVPEQWMVHYEFTATKIQKFPLPSECPTELAAILDDLAQQLATNTPSAIVGAGVPTVAVLRGGRTRWESIRGKMIALQEELDWQVYSLYRLHAEDLRAPETDVPGLTLGERAFEIVLARRVANGEASNGWFTRHGSTPITEIPAHWSESYRQVVQRRIEVIESSRAIGMVERPEYKRRWATEGWDVLQAKALRSWLLDRIETREHWFDANGMPTLVTLARLIDTLARDEDFASVAKLYAPHKELTTVVGELMVDEHVPFLASLCYKPSGLRKRADWEHVWDLQRQEDAAPDEPARRKIRDTIPVPPKYTSADFVKPSYWRARGKLDVPKERFISYPTALSGLPELYGWAGWAHREQAQALATYFTNQALSSEEITPFLAGLLELQPWLKQWHDEFDPLYSGSPAAFFDSYRQQIQGEHGLTDDDLRAWRPEPPVRGRGRGTAKKK